MSSIIDNSTQLNTSNLNLGIINTSIPLPFLTLSIASNIFISSNVLINAFLPTKQNILTSSTVLLGTGGSITAIDYNNITINKPTNFQCDYTTTLINKPTNFQSDYNSTVITTPNLTIYDTITSRITAINNQNIINSNYFISSNILNTYQYATISSVNNQNIANSNYFISSNISTNIFNNLIGPYDTVSARNTALSSYLPLSGGTLTGNLIINSTNGGLILQNGSGGAFGYASAINNYSTSASAGDVVLRGAGNNLILQSGSSTAALTINSANNISITNTLNATTIQQGGVGVSSLISSAITS